MRARLAAVPLLAVALCASACGGAKAPKGDALIVVSAPLTSSPWIGDFMKKGADLAASEINKTSGRHVKIELLDNGGSAQTVVAQARQAVSQHAVALLIDGVGAKAVAAVTDPVSLPVFITFDGGADLTDPVKLPTLFRIAPANVDMIRRLSDYLADVQKNKSVALLTDDSQYGEEGASNLKADLVHDDITIANQQTIPATPGDVSAQVLAARRSGAKVLVIWARAGNVASIIRTARSTGWEAPVYTGPEGEDPLVRQELADKPQYLDGTVFVSFRITSEQGPKPFEAYRKLYEKAYGVTTFGVKTKEGVLVQEPPDWSMYPYDAVNLIEAALKGKAPTALNVYNGIQATVITSANGDERGYSPQDRETVSPDDMYFAYFTDMKFEPKLDDILSTTLPTVKQ